MKNLLNIFVSITISLILLTSAGSIALQQPQPANAQNITKETRLLKKIKTIFWYLDKEQ